ncbi:class I SAM-dependent DNA methyltransferase [Halarcobacter ebronensis]|uniref:Methyltransferase n=1 Tax=Halarcobacter ebronensis TaxID=1462615 RepID=A0A4Q1AY10_9BACT|nr:class I SAM-dependent methyltransferase [Halarcobacter ebronensis]QKF80992.1 methyltransferase [Halarcobacter ebronensis]RXK06306.1 methyltransferase [Halarcobacter ebronensis]
MGLNLYSKIEPYLDFQEEVYALHREFMALVMTKELNNILDIGCGQGYFLENLTLNGINSFGIDLSKDQIEACKKRGIENVQSIALEDLSEKFDCATAIFDVINYIPKQQLEKFFKDTYKVLNDNGYFIFDVNSLFGFDEVAQGCITIDLEDKFIALDAIFEDDKLITNITLFSQSKDDLYKKESDFITQYYHSKEALKKLLKRANFSIEEVREFNLHGFEQTDKLIFICKKN